MPKPADMSGKVALVTGAAGGLGRATALDLARAGSTLWLVDRSAPALEAVADEARVLGVSAFAHVADLADPQACHGAVPAAVAHYGGLDALCNVAGVMIPGHSAEVPVADFQAHLAINLAAPFYLFQAAVPHLLERRGAVVNVASAVGISAQAYTAAYCASKAGLIHLTRCLAMEYMLRGIRINAVAPGGMMTPLAGAMAHFECDRRLQDRTTPMRGLVEIGLVAEMVAFLASDAAEGYHGSVVVIDNGMTVG